MIRIITGLLVMFCLSGCMVPTVGVSAGTGGLSAGVGFPAGLSAGNDQFDTTSSINPTCGVVAGIYVVNWSQNYGLRVGITTVGKNCGMTIGLFNIQDGYPAFLLGLLNFTGDEGYQTVIGVVNSGGFLARNKTRINAGVLQLGALNSYQDGFATQVGAINIAEYGVQLGVLNYNHNSWVKWMILLNYSGRPKEITAQQEALPE